MHKRILTTAITIALIELTGCGAPTTGSSSTPASGKQDDDIPIHDNPSFPINILSGAVTVTSSVGATTFSYDTFVEVPTRVIFDSSTGIAGEWGLSRDDGAPTKHHVIHFDATWPCQRWTIYNMAPGSNGAPLGSSLASGQIIPTIDAITVQTKPNEALFNVETDLWIDLVLELSDGHEALEMEGERKQHTLWTGALSPGKQYTVTGAYVLGDAKSLCRLAAPNFPFSTPLD